MNDAPSEIQDGNPDILANYALEPEELQVLSKQLLHERPPEGRGRYVCYSLAGEDPYANLGRHVEQAVFNESFGNGPEVMHEEYGPYEAASNFFVVMDQEAEQPIGVLRVIKNSPAGLKTLNDMQRLSYADGQPIDITPEAFMEHYGLTSLDDCWDIGTVAVPKEFRDIENSLVSTMLYRAMHMRALYEGVNHYVSIIDKKARGIFDWVGIPFQPLMDTHEFPYLGSQDSMLLYGDATDFIAGVERRYAEAPPAERAILERYAGRLASGHEIDANLMFDYS